MLASWAEAILQGKEKVLELDNRCCIMLGMTKCYRLVYLKMVTLLCVL